MTKRQYRDYSVLFTFFSVVFSVLLVRAVYNEDGINRLISVVLFGFLIFQQVRLALLMSQKARDLDLK